MEGGIDYMMLESKQCAYGPAEPGRMLMSRADTDYCKLKECHTIKFIMIYMLMPSVSCIYIQLKNVVIIITITIIIRIILSIVVRQARSIAIVLLLHPARTTK
jgi:hypothetical protein